MNNSINKLKQLVAISKAKYDINNISKAYFLLNKPLKDINVIHVAGTNGKGSVCHKIAKSLFYSGYKVGLFTSPHISTVRERIMVNFEMISKSDFEIGLEDIFNVIDSIRGDFNFFEVLTLLAGKYFQKNKIDFAVIEAGLGGRLDATNVVESNFSVITSIGYDHQHILGETLDEIAAEKAGIIKPNIPVILGPFANYEAIKLKAKKFLAPVYQVQEKPLSYDEENQLIAKKTLSLLKNQFLIKNTSIQQALRERPICRFEIFDRSQYVNKFSKFPKKVILDVAHNVDGLKKLKKTLLERFKVDKYIVLLGISKDKEIKKFCDFLSKFAQEIHLANSHHPRLLPVNKIKPLIPSDIKVFQHDNFSNAIKELLQKENEHLLVLGSFYFMNEIRDVLGVNQEKDQFSFNEGIPKV